MPSEAADDGANRADCIDTGGIYLSDTTQTRLPPVFRVGGRATIFEVPPGCPDLVGAEVEILDDTRAECEFADGRVDRPLALRVVTSGERLVLPCAALASPPDLQSRLGGVAADVLQHILLSCDCLSSVLLAKVCDRQLCAIGRRVLSSGDWRREMPSIP